ncbi:hypothetical protein KBD45_01215 [Candidatus Dojkabacteria bacterium]|nr:hypothetical protein [Candidatus Dojkabacteria bacterium]
MKKLSYLKKGFTRTAGLTMILTSALSTLSGVYVLDQTGVMDKLYQAAHKSDVNSIEQGINAYIIDKQGNLPQPVEKLKSGVYDVCKQGMQTCPEGSVALDVLVSEGYLKEIPSSYLTATDTLTGFKLTYNADKYLITIQDEAGQGTSVFNGVQTKGLFVFSESASLINNYDLDGYDIVIKEGVTLTIEGVHQFASIINYGEIYISQRVELSDSSNLEISTNNIVNMGKISADDIQDNSGGSIKLIVLNNFINTGLITAGSSSSEINTTGGEITIIADKIQLNNESISTASLNGNHGQVNLFYKEYLGPDFNTFTSSTKELRSARISD